MNLPTQSAVQTSIVSLTTSLEEGFVAAESFSSGEEAGQSICASLAQTGISRRLRGLEGLVVV